VLLLKEEEQAAVQMHPFNVRLEDVVKLAKTVVAKDVVTSGKMCLDPP
jgi:hypothetical protein